MPRIGIAVSVVVALLAGCPTAPPVVKNELPDRSETSGGALLLDIRPSGRPGLVGNFEFDLLAEIGGAACVTRESNTSYWLGLNDLSKLSPDPLGRQAIAAAAIDAIARIEEADTILITRVVVDGKGPDKVCAHVLGRGIRLVKAGTEQPASHD